MCENKLYICKKKNSAPCKNRRVLHLSNIMPRMHAIKVSPCCVFVFSFFFPWVETRVVKQITYHQGAFCGQVFHPEGDKNLSERWITPKKLPLVAANTIYMGPDTLFFLLRPHDASSQVVTSQDRTNWQYQQFLHHSRMPL